MSAHDERKPVVTVGWWTLLAEIAAVSMERAARDWEAEMIYEFTYGVHDDE